MTATRQRIELGRGGGYCTFRQRGLYTVDKTLFIQHVIEASYGSMLIPRPRRFGKTFNLMTLLEFLERPASPKQAEAIRSCFEGAQIWDIPSAREHFQRYPVLFFSFRACKGLGWEDAWSNIRTELIKMLDKHRALLDTPDALTPGEAHWFREGLSRSLSSNDYSRLLEILSQALFRLYGTPVVILIDEYDTPIHAGIEKGYYAEAVDFFKRFLTLGFKDNPFLFKGVITGILRVSKENMFSELNNVGVYSLLSDSFTTDFGLTQEEVVQVLEDQGCPQLLPDIEMMYNGYLFGTDPPVAIYNPWSTLSCVANPKHKLQPYWHKSGSPELLHRLIVKNGPSIHTQLQRLLELENLPVFVSEHIDLTLLEQSPENLFSFMLFTGYLKATQVSRQGTGWYVTVALVNQELHQILSDLYQDFLVRGRGNRDPEPFLRAVLGGNPEALQAELAGILRKNASFLDGATRKPENFYQGLMLGLLLLLKHEYQVISNLETGLGRADLLLIPKTAGKVGVVMELKVVPEDGSLEAALLAGLNQLEAQQYTSRLEEAQATPIHAYAVAFDGKVVRVASPAQKDALLKELELARAQVAPAGVVTVPSAPPVSAPTRVRRTTKRQPTARPLELAVEDRLALEALVVPLLAPGQPQRLLLRVGGRSHRLVEPELADQWAELVQVCEEQGRLQALLTLISLTFPSLKTEPLLIRLLEQFQR